MQTTLGALAHAEPALVRLGQQPVSFKTAYHLKKLITQVQAETKYFHEQREVLIRTHGSERPITPIEALQGLTGPVWEVTETAKPVFTPLVEELCAVPVQITGWLLSADLLEELKLSAADLTALDPLILSD